MSNNNTLPNDYCILDVETTGLDVRDEIIEIGIYRVRNNEIVDRFTSYVKPERRRIYADVRRLTNITPGDVKKAPTLLALKDRILNFIGSDPILGYNVSFGMEFLESGLLTHLRNQRVDVLDLVKSVYRGRINKFSLYNVAKFLGVGYYEHHVASDCCTIKEVYDCAKEEYYNPSPFTLPDTPQTQSYAPQNTAPPFPRIPPVIPYAPAEKQKEESGLSLIFRGFGRLIGAVFSVVPEESRPAIQGIVFGLLGLGAILTILFWLVF